MTRTPTPSLHRRVTTATVGVIAVMLFALGGVVDELVGVQLNRDVDSRLADGIVRATTLVEAGVGPAEVVNQLQGQRIRVQVIGRDGARYGDLAIAPTPSPPPQGGLPAPPSAGERTSKKVTRILPDGSKLTMVAKTAGIHARRAQLRRDMLVGGAITLVLVALLVRIAVGRALAPLKRMTSTAERITYGDRGRRLRPDRPRTELGHAAAAFDNMLDALENAETNARQAAEVAQRAEAKTRQFLSDAAHELRSPVAAIQAVAQQLAASTEGAGDCDTGSATVRRRRYAALLSDETRRAGRLVSDLLDIANIDAGVALPDGEVDLADIVATEVDRAAMLAPGLTVRLVGDSANLPIRADPSRIAQILSNLLDNARRHTPQGGEITVRTAARGHNAEVTVVDSGPGIPPADRERVFDRLVRLDDARDRDSGGAGLGLPIARALAHAHHGILECIPESSGAAFRFTLPMVPESTDGTSS
ncbi:HAMP domain-containing sensor histidine kinase [Mycobacterium sp.]|uniref:sensor histidine kinase n=2 Tax=Mycobacterium sp. TaxID=1785 RepID=UPI0031D1264C